MQKIVSGNLSVRKVEKLVKKYLTSPKTVKIPNDFAAKNNIDSANLGDIEDKLRKLFGTKVLCRQKKDGSGEVIIEFYSADELERLFELFEIIDKSYS